MIKIQANSTDILNIERELGLKIGGIKELSSPKVLEELGNAVFTLGATAFKKAMDIQAKGNPKKYHHVYEWNQVGMPMGRLFFLRRMSSVNGKVYIRPEFVKSKNKVPVDPALLNPGKAGKSVASRHVFRDKAFIMETGKPIIYRASKNLPIPKNGKVKFVAAGTIIKNYNPGGKEVKGSFETFFNYWFDQKINEIINSSGIIRNIDNETAKALNVKGAGPAEVRKALISLFKQYSKGQVVV